MNKFTYLLFFVFAVGTAQNIKVNNKKHTVLVFESNIASGIVSNDDFSFEYNESTPDNIALLKANKSKAEETSLVIKTSNGTIFNFTVSYGDSEDNILRILDTDGINTKSLKTVSSSGTNVVSKNEEKQNNTSTEVNASIKENDYTIGDIVINDMINNEIDCPECVKVLNDKKSIKRILDENYKVKIQLNNIYYSNNKLYFLLNFINESDLDYNLNYIKSYVSTGNDSKATSSQYLEKYPALIYNSNRTIPGGTERQFVFVYEQFTIDNNKKFVFEVNENNGERNLFLKIPHFLINNPKKLK